MADVSQSLKLSSGYDMPTVALGTWTMWNHPEGEMGRVLKTAIRAGYRHIDTAKSYGTEPLMGPALTELINDGEIKREDVFITSKVWCTDHHPDQVKDSVEKTLKDLQTDYLDMLLIHYPMAYQAGEDNFPKDSDGKTIYADVDYLDTWKAMEEFVNKGQVRSIGLSNFNKEQIQRVIDNAEIQPCNLQIEISAYHLNHELTAWCHEKGIVVSAFAPFGNPSRFWRKPEDTSLLEESIVAEIAERHGKTPAQVLLRYLLQRGVVVLPKSVTDSRIKQNFDVYEFELSEEDMTSLEGLNRNLRVYCEDFAKDSPYYPW